MWFTTRGDITEYFKSGAIEILNSPYSGCLMVADDAVLVTIVCGGNVDLDAYRRWTGDRARA